MMTDESIVEQVLAGNDEAYRELVNRHHARCIRYALRMLGDADEADDVAQEAFLRAYRSLATCANPARFRSWLFQILVNRCRSALERRVNRERWFVQTNIDDCQVPIQPADYNSPPPRFELLEQIMGDLPMVQREALVLKFVEDMTYEEMAEVTGATVSALKMRVSRASEVLRSRLLVKR